MSTPCAEQQCQSQALLPLPYSAGIQGAHASPWEGVDVAVSRSVTEPESQRSPTGHALNLPVFLCAVAAIVVFTVWTLAATETAAAWIGAMLDWVSATFGWFYMVAVVVYLGFVVFIAVSPFGSIRLGPDDARPEFPLLSWAAMLFAAGIGIDLLFFCVAEPVTHFLAPPAGEGGTPEAARHAMQLTFLHWGLSGWGVYALVGMTLAFFSYRRGLPLSIRSALYPLLGRRVHGGIGHAVDIAAVLATVFGIATSLGIGIIQLNHGLHDVFGVPENALVQGLLAVLIVVFAAISAALGVARGIRRLSEFNMLLAAAFLIFVLLAGDTVFLLNALIMNVGDYLGGFIALSFNTYAFAPPADWLNAWTLFFWAWWIAWGPFVGLFLARISRGRTIRSFVIGTLTLPLAFMAAWMSVMGNSAIDLVLTGAAAFGEAAVNAPGSALYGFLHLLPWTGVTTIVVTVLAIVFFVTSGDSGSLVLASFTSRPRTAVADAPVWLRVLWAVIIGALTLALLMAGGLQTLQSAVVVMGLPFAVVLLLMAVGLYRGLRAELSTSG
jgi:choline/glycine/proline betaine transport protein